MTGRRRFSKANLLLYLILTVYAVIVIYPLVMMVMLSFKTKAEIFLNPLGLPLSLSFANYVQAWNAAKFGSFFRNSAIVSVASVLSVLVVSSMAAFVLARRQFRGRNALQTLFVCGLMLPMRLCIIPLFNLIKGIGLEDTHLALILTYTASNLAFSIFILTGFFKSIPMEIEEAALLDGCNDFRVYFRISLPMIRPALATTAIFTFVSIWNDLFYPLIFIRTQALRTLPLGIAMFVGEYNTEWSLLFAGITMAVLPTIAVYLVMSRQFVEGLSAGAFK